MSGRDNLLLFKDKILKGEQITKEEAIELYKIKDIEELLRAANEIREHYMGNKVDLCTIMNAKSGRCSEDCKYCAQSSHYRTGIEEYPLVTKEAALKRARENMSLGVHHFSLVTSGSVLKGDDFNTILEIFAYLHKELPELKLCASLGMISLGQAQQLKMVGVETYHHNLETGKNFFHNICTTHTYDERMQTIHKVQEAGVYVCSGGIIGMGETIEDRIDMALELRNLGIKSVPINVLNPIPGTPLENKVILKPQEILQTMAIYRFILPMAYIRYAGGRQVLKQYQEKGFQGGVNAALVGNYLTTIGKRIEDDIKMITALGLKV